jgi:ATP-dependent Lhr-like helicase
MDADGFERLLKRIEAGEVILAGRDLTEPSPLAAEILGARPYAFLDDAPLEERRTQAVMSRRFLDPATAADLGRLDPEAIARVKQEAWPDPESADELHDALLWLMCLTEEEVKARSKWQEFLDELVKQRRVTRIAGQKLWIAVERLPEWRAALPNSRAEPPLEPPAELAKTWEHEAAVTEIVRGRLEGLGPVTPSALATSLAFSPSAVAIALAKLESEGFAMRGRFTPDAREEEWCERRLLARVNRYTLKRLRAEIEPVSSADYLRFLTRWQRLAPGEQMEGPDAVAAVIAQLEGFQAPAIAWETEILPRASRVTTRNGSTTFAARDASSGRGSMRRAPIASELPARCAQRR